MERTEKQAAAGAKTKPPGVRCPAEATLGVIGGRWKVPILWHLLDGTKRFSELRRALGNVTQKMLSQQLRELERDGVVRRKVYPEVPPRVEYALTPLGATMSAPLRALGAWSLQHGRKVESARERFDEARAASSAARL